ncbi:ABC transporter ATP-binding protein [candidate division KSB1 bacterium]|nr:ABC transporter ATP-binding protein [candidate division KSB1 bacterium]
MRALQTDRLTKIFRSGKVTALNQVTLSVDTGHIFGLLGPNGAGKTTLIKILLGILYPTSGMAKVFDQPINTIAVKEKIGYLPENHRYPEFLKGGEVLDYFARLSGVEKQRREANKKRLLKLVNMEKWQHTKLKKYSKGMLQRLGLAQAMMNDPDLLFLDEPTDGVDPIGRKEIRDILHRLQSEGKTIFLNSHLLSEVETTCDQVAILDRGKLLRTGTVEELTSPSKTLRFQVSKIPQDILKGLHKFSLMVELDNSSLHVTCANQKKINGVIDYLRQHNIDIRSILPHRQSLEESFIEILKKDAVD